MFGNAAIAASPTTRYLTPSYANSLAETVATGLPSLVTGTLSRLYVRHGAPSAGPPGNITYTVMINGVATALAVTVASNSSGGSNLVTTVPINQGDIVTVRVTKGAPIAGSPSNVYAEMLVQAA